MRLSRSLIIVISLLTTGVMAADSGYFANILSAPIISTNFADTGLNSIDSLVPDTMANSPISDSVKNGSLLAAPKKKPWPTGALLRSAFIPGCGQVYNGQYLKAAIYGGSEIALGLSTIKYWRRINSHQRNFMGKTAVFRPPGGIAAMPGQAVLLIDANYRSAEFTLYENAKDNRNLYLWLTGLTLFVSMFDAYVDAHFADFNQTDKAFEAQLYPRNDGVYLAVTYNLK